MTSSQEIISAYLSCCSQYDPHSSHRCKHALRATLMPNRAGCSPVSHFLRHTKQPFSSQFVTTTSAMEPTHHLVHLKHATIRRERAPTINEFLPPQVYKPIHLTHRRKTDIHGSPSVGGRQHFPDGERRGFDALDHKSVWRAIVIKPSNTQ